MICNEMFLIVNKLVFENVGKPINTLLTEYGEEFSDVLITGELLINRKSNSVFIKGKSKRKTRSFSMCVNLNGSIQYWLSTYGHWTQLKVPKNIMKDIV